jgi:hypothetical protein
LQSSGADPFGFDERAVLVLLGKLARAVPITSSISGAKVMD